MDNKKLGKFYVDWWNIRKSTVYGISAVVVLLFLLTVGGWWFLQSSYLTPKPDNNDFPKDAAQIISFDGDVRVIRAATRETILVTGKTYVAAGDTVQTQADGRAQIQMIDGSTLSIRPNSTVVIRDSQSLFGGTKVGVKLDDGQINVKTQNQTEATENVVEVMESKNRMLSETDASFNINEQTNGGEIRISRGGVESTVGNEKTVIKDGEFAAVNNGRLSTKERLLMPPKLTSPTAAEQITAVASGFSDVTFRWQKPETASELNYALEVAKSPFFVADAMILQRESLANTNFTFGNIAPGIYYWRTRAAAASGQISEWSEPLKFAVIKRAASAELTASDWQVEKIGGNIYSISGRTQPGAVVRSSGRETFATGDGSFRLQISAASSETTVEISDESGNRSRYILSLNSGRAVKQ
jgi:hypothetical protein